MKLALAFTLALLFATGCAAAAALAFDAGKLASRRECPAAQQGAKLLYSEQRATGTVCTYASGWEGYGRRLERKRL